MSASAPDRTLAFDELQRAFTQLTDPQQPGAPLTITFTGVPGLPQSAVTLPDLRSRLLHPATPYAARDAALNELLHRVQHQLAHCAEGGSHAGEAVWSVALSGVLLPGLRRAVWPLGRAHPGLLADLQVEALAGLLSAAATCPLGLPRVAARLTWAARRQAETVLRAEVRELAEPVEVLPELVTTDLPPAVVPAGEPEDVLTRAIREGVLRPADAALIQSTRLDGVPLAEAAARLGCGYKAVGKRRERAERALVAWLGSRPVGELNVTAERTAQMPRMSPQQPAR